MLLIVFACDDGKKKQCIANRNEKERKLIIEKKATKGERKEQKSQQQ